MVDHISNLIIKIKNGSRAGKESVTAPYSKMTESILALLEKDGFIKGYAKKGKGIIKEVEITLAYEENGKPRVSEVERVSKLSRRVYKGSKSLKPVRNGYGTLVVSTPSGILSDKDARKQNVGGEALFKIW